MSPAFVEPDDDGRSHYERMVAGDWYRGDEQIGALGRRGQDLAARYADEFRTDRAAAQATLAELLGSLGQDTTIRPPLSVDYGAHLHVGARTFVNFGLVALDVAPIHIGDAVQIGPNVQLLTPVHPLDADARRDGWEAAEPITIGDNVWLGGGVIVCPGVTIGENTVVGAGAVVTKDLPANVLAVGNPARVIRSL
jgi:maltose O-acetyltransferase